MIHAYDEMYLEEAMNNLGEAFDYAVNGCSWDADEFMRLFISTGVSQAFGKGNPRVLCGMSGIELVMTVAEKAGTSMTFQTDVLIDKTSPEYWCGKLLAYYQWSRGVVFSSIHDTVPVQEIMEYYNMLKRTPNDKAGDIIHGIIAARLGKKSKLQMQRKNRGFSQRELSERAGVNIRTLQQYESGAKDISKAAVETVLSIANVLGCRIENIL